MALVKNPKRCPSCGKSMLLERVLPKFGELPERWIYKCLACGNVLKHESDE